MASGCSCSGIDHEVQSPVLDDSVMGQVQDIVKRVDTAAELQIVRYAASGGRKHGWLSCKKLPTREHRHENYVGKAVSYCVVNRELI